MSICFNTLPGSWDRCGQDAVADLSRRFSPRVRQKRDLIVARHPILMGQAIYIRDGEAE